MSRKKESDTKEDIKESIVEEVIYDPVNNPEHYVKGGIECIDAMEAAFGGDVVKHFCLGNTFKYLWRCYNKGKFSEDIAKAKWYLNKVEEFSDRD